MMTYRQYEDYVLEQETHISVLDDKIENLYNAGRDEEAKKLTITWKQEVQQLDKFIAEYRKKVSSKNMKKTKNW